MNNNIDFQSKDLWIKTFGDKKEFVDKYFSLFDSTNNLQYILNSQNKIISMFLGCKYLWHYYRQNIDFVYLCGVCTDKQYRHQGFSSQLIKDSLLKYYQQGIVLSGLICARQELKSFYSKLSFIDTSFNCQKVFHRKDINKLLIDNYILVNSINFSFPQIQQMLTQKHNTICHNKDDLSFYQEDNYLCHTLIYQSSIRAICIGIKRKDYIYLVYLNCLTSQAKEAILSHLSHLYKREIRYQEIDNSHKNKDLQMYRIINVKRILQLYAYYNPDIKQSLHIRDNIIPENNITVCLDKGELRLIDNSYQVPSIDIDILTQRLFSNANMQLMLDK